MDEAAPFDQPELNTGKPWSEWDDQDIRWGLDHDRSIEETADFLCRTTSEIRQRIREIARGRCDRRSLIAARRDDGAGVPVGFNCDALAVRAMALIREAVEDCAPPGSVPRDGYLTPEFTVEAEALVRGIYAIAGRPRRAASRKRRR